MRPWRFLFYSDHPPVLYREMYRVAMQCSSEMFYFKTNCNLICNADNNRSVTFEKPSTEVNLQ